MKVVLIGSTRPGKLRWRLGTWIKELGERKGNDALVCLGNRIKWGR